MTPLLVVGGVVIAFILALLRALAMDELRGRIQRQVEASVEATISALPIELQEEWAEEWRAELDAMKSMPLSAIAFARGLRHTALQLSTDWVSARWGLAQGISLASLRRRRRLNLVGATTLLVGSVVTVILTYPSLEAKLMTLSVIALTLVLTAIELRNVRRWHSERESVSLPRSGGPGRIHRGSSDGHRDRPLVGD